jgi:hypothetical protein
VVTILLSAYDAAIEYAHRRASQTHRVVEVWTIDNVRVHAGSAAPLGAWVLHVAAPERTIADLVRN